MYVRRANKRGDARQCLNDGPSGTRVLAADADRADSHPHDVNLAHSSSAISDSLGLNDYFVGPATNAGDLSLDDSDRQILSVIALVEQELGGAVGLQPLWLSEDRDHLTAWHADRDFADITAHGRGIAAGAAGKLHQSHQRDGATAD